MRSRISYVLIATSFIIFIVLLEQRALFIGVDCLSFQYNLWKKLERAPQKFSRAPLPVIDASIITVKPTPSSPKSCILPCNEIRNSDRKAACVFVCVCACVCVWGGQSVYLPPPPVTHKPPRHSVCCSTLLIGFCLSAPEGNNFYMSLDSI